MALRLTAILLCVSGCTAIVASPPERRIRCAIGPSGDPCPAGLRCFEGFCTIVGDAGLPCMDNETGCNTIDDDCDGITDEGSDLDRDGVTWCNSDPSLRDCRDDNPNIHPAGPDTPAPEDGPCDGADNDCDGVSEQCPSGQVCDAAGACRVPDCSFSTPCPTGQRCDTSLDPPDCVVVAVDCMETGCAAPLVCDPISRECLPPRDLGAECAFDAQCGPGMICVETQALELTPSHVGRAARVCSMSCCTHDDCPASSLCWAPGNGARGCLPTSILDMGAGGAPAEDLCANTNDCGDECVLRSAPAYENASRTTYACGPAPGSGTGMCDTSSDCRSGVCVEYCDEFGFICEGWCSAPCASSDDCLSDIEHCSWVFANAQQDIVPSCVIADAGGASGGASCSRPSDCRDSQCLMGDDGTRYCADVCCSDDHCASGHRCRPSVFGGRYWVMLCVRD